MSSISTSASSRTLRPSIRTRTSRGRRTTADGSISTTARRPTGDPLASLEEGVDPDLHRVGLEEAVRGFKEGVVAGRRDDERDDEIAFVSHRDAFHEALASALPDAVE